MEVLMILRDIKNASKPQYEYIDRRAIKNIIDTIDNSWGSDKAFFKKLTKLGKDELEKAILRCVYRKARYKDWKIRA
jgi:hypothetical protein